MYRYKIAPLLVYCRLACKKLLGHISRESPMVTDLYHFAFLPTSLYCVSIKIAVSQDGNILERKILHNSARQKMPVTNTIDPKKVAGEPISSASNICALTRAAGQACEHSAWATFSQLSRGSTPGTCGGWVIRLGDRDNISDTQLHL